MTETDVARYVAMVERAVKAAELSPGVIDPTTLVREAELVVDQLKGELEKDGLIYGPNNRSNESRATSRAILWAAWVSWLWASKAETRQPPDEQAKQARPIAEKLLADAVEFGRKIGKEGGAEDFLKKKGLHTSMITSGPRERFELDHSG